MSGRSTARAVYLALQQKARREKRATQELFELYMLEGVLARLAASVHRDTFVLKGGVLLAAFGNRRPTRDVDLEAMAVSNDADTITTLLREVLAEPVDDGLVFDVDSLEAQVIREEDEYSGVRVGARAVLDTAKLGLHIDVSVGDPIHPAPRRGVRAESSPRPRPIVVRGYPMAMVFAEKLVTAMQRGTASTRWRDYGDVWTLSRSHPVDGAQLQAAVHAVVAARGVSASTLANVLEGYGLVAQSKWEAWRRRQGMSMLPADFAEVIDHVIAFGDPVFGGKVDDRTWSPTQLRWR